MKGNQGAAVEAGRERQETSAWHSLPEDQVLRAWHASPEGLGGEEARRRLAVHGPNRLPEAKARGAFVRFLAQFNNLLIFVLIAAAAITAALGHWIDTGVILGVVIVNAVIGFVQEGKAEDALRAIRDMLSLQAMVVRDGQRVTVPAEELVPGDVVLIQSGDKVPADLRLLRAKSLQIQESVLTGESVAVEKRVDSVPAGAGLGDRLSMAYSGTMVTYGQGAGVVVASGAGTEIGRISTLVAQIEPLSTPLLRQMAVFARWLTAAILLLAVVVFFFGLLARNVPAVEMFMTVVGLAVAAIPEGLPAILTVTLAIGVQRMASRNAIIRRLPAVETLGSVSTICSDKTGTLTRNEMMVQSIAISEATIDVSGAGYDPHGAFLHQGRTIPPDENPVLLELLRCGMLCNESSLKAQDGEWHMHGDPMEGALLVAGSKAGRDPETEAKEFPRTDLIPFESTHKFMATLHHSHSGEGFIFVKGAPERVLSMCAYERTSTGDQSLEAAAWHARIEELAGHGQRVLAAAFKPARSQQQDLLFEDIEGLVLLGLFGLIDPPRAEAAAAVRQCQSAGVRVKMITGDHATTARAIAAQLRLANTGEALSGRELDAMSDQALANRVTEVDVYARVSPENKLRLVRLLQAHGAIVAMTGDGVNDAPALKQADVGIAMGRKGTEAAKEASEMVLADDNFASIVRAVEEGRTVYENLKKAIVFLLPVNGGESLSIMAAVLLGYTLPITPLQILWVNMVSSVALAMALAFEPMEPDTMRRPPRPARESILSGFLVWRILFVSTLFAVGVFGLFFWTQQQGATLEEARTYAVNTLVAMEVFYLFSVRFLHAPSLTLKGFLGTRAVVIAVTVVVALQLLFTYAPFMEELFDTRPVDFVHGLEIVLVAVALFGMLEAEKLIRRKLMPA